MFVAKGVTIGLEKRLPAPLTGGFDLPSEESPYIVDLSTQASHAMPFRNRPLWGDKSNLKKTFRLKLSTMLSFQRSFHLFSLVKHVEVLGATSAQYIGLNVCTS